MSLLDESAREAKLEAKRAANRAAVKRYRERHPERRNAWAQAHSDAMREYQRAWRAANGEKCREYTRKYETANWERRARAKHENNAAWLDKNPEARSTYLARGRAKKLQSPGAGVHRAQWREVLALFGGRCAYCAKVAKLTMDHIEPLSRGGAHDVANVVPACGTCNSRKHAMPLLRWLSLLTNQRVST